MFSYTFINQEFNSTRIKLSLNIGMRLRVNWRSSFNNINRILYCYLSFKFLIISFFIVENSKVWIFITCIWINLRFNHIVNQTETMTIADLITARVATIGEKITIRRFARYAAAANTMVDTYIHMGGKVGVMVELSFTEKTDALVDVAHDVALQIAAASPVAPEYVRRSEVRADHLEHEKEILAAQARNEGKPEKIIEKMVMGRVQKFYKEVCLLEQLFVKDPDVTVEKMIAANAKGADVVRFVRYKMGEGLEKRVDDLAAEVAAQTAGIK